MGLGGLWQNISWLLSNQTESLEINLHLDDWNAKRFIEIFNCFQTPRHPVEIKIKEILHYDTPVDTDWHSASQEIISNIQLKTDYIQKEIQTVSCALHHQYWPVNQNRNILDHVCTYLRYTDENKIKPRPVEYNIDRDLTIEQADSVYDTLKKHNINYIELGPNYSLSENCQLISQARFVIGREGGWTHVANSARVDYYPVMNNRHYFLDTCHGDQNKYLKDYTHVDDFELLLRKIL
jgi:hypothetical protein